MPENQSPPPRRRPHGLMWFVIVVVLAVGAFAFLDFGASTDYLTKSKMTKVLAALDPVKQSLVRTYQEKGKLPQVTTIVTQANQGKAATPDWAALGFETFPALPREASSLSITPDGEIVVMFANIGTDIDNTELRTKATLEPLKRTPNWRWIYECTSTRPMLRRYFHCG